MLWKPEDRKLYQSDNIISGYFYKFMRHLLIFISKQCILRFYDEVLPFASIETYELYNERCVDYLIFEGWDDV